MSETKEYHFHIKSGMIRDEKTAREVLDMMPEGFDFYLLVHDENHTIEKEA